MAGFDGTVRVSGIAAPLPTSDYTESPNELKATKRISTEAKSARLNPEALRVVTGIEQLVAWIIKLFVVASQLLVSYCHVPVEVLISTL